MKSFKQLTPAENRQRMLDGKLYDPGEATLMAEQTRYQAALADYNQLSFGNMKARRQWLQDHFASVGADCYIEQPFYANWAGHHVHLGDGVYANFHLTLVDDGDIFIGDHVMMGPNVTIATAGHPIEPTLRRYALQHNQPVHVGDNVWLGANVTVLPGVTIGANTVVGAGSVVTKDLPANVVAVGTPVRVQRPINAHDRDYYYQDRPIDITVPDGEATDQ